MIKRYKEFINENVDYRKLSNQFKSDCFSDLEDMCLIVRLNDNLMDGIEDGSRFQIKISKYDFDVDIEEFDQLSQDEMNDEIDRMHSDEGIFIMNDEIINIIRFANSYCKELGIGPGWITYHTFDPDVDSESELHSFKDIEELASKYKKCGNKVSWIDMIYVFTSKYEKFNEDLDHLSTRGIDPNVTYFVHDDQSNNTYFFLYNLSGECIGYQKYNPDNEKAGGLGWMGRYFTKVHKEATGHSKIAVYGLETYDDKKDYFFVAEGIFDIIKVHNTGEPGIANLGCSLSGQAKNWYNSLSQKKIVIQDRDDAGTELGAIGDYIYTVPEPYKDLGEMPQEEVNEFIRNIKNEIGL